ncbi:TetR/AcrR family transcriptional regulator [Saccharopolyspora sp. HNM0983]|uniref:TetR/AcrR family transcriptional regulator n=1 Tax=Saccharopolyspora montiporae TaxID=2781240 RepID=A0A929B5W7_9PSEU|nr:TetR/AcrR family transcriptional regulator [Saccharopolyspora sp. HNM0983]
MARADRSAATREVILTTAERLFVEHGIGVVSNRQISEAAGQGNNTAVGYHFGTRADLVRAIVRRHYDAIEGLRRAAVDRVGESAGVREWAACMVHPPAHYLAELGSPTWYARFIAQAITDPAYRGIITEESLNSPALRETTAGLNRCIPDLPDEVRRERRDMARQLMVHIVADREGALAEGTPTARDTWRHVAAGLVDAVTGLWHAPVTRPAQDRPDDTGNENRRDQR